MDISKACQDGLEELDSLLGSDLPADQSSSSRSSSESDTGCSHESTYALRIASWNLRELTDAKASKNIITDNACRIINENEFNIVGIQEVQGEQALVTMCEKLNQLNNRKCWKCVVSDIAGRGNQGMERLGFLYDESQGLADISSRLLECYKLGNLIYEKEFHIDYIKNTPIDSHCDKSYFLKQLEETGTETKQICTRHPLLFRFQVNII
ncbi:uncharacterized protein LOC131929835 [Physella acuta]|uniref:uncharacterized protein LOC131929835 n=1 Tax=Physella acuta TaxID=109671 RepID=UPI0027DD60D1|nr:uncharacterized protein LOC131929835 [Physella acuta]